MFLYKSKTLIFFGLLILSLLACKKKLIRTIGWSNADIDAKAWSANRCTHGVIFDSLIGLSFKQGYLESENTFHLFSDLSFFSLEKKIGRQYLNSKPSDSLHTAFDTINSFALFSYYLQSGDELCSRYMVWEEDSLNNWVEIDKVEGDFDKIWGSYNITMIPDTSRLKVLCDKNIYGDTIRITNGRFYSERYYP